MSSEDDRIIAEQMREREPIHALCLDGPLRGRIQEMPKSGYVAIEYRAGQSAMDFGEATQRHYRPHRLMLFDYEVWIASCQGPNLPVRAVLIAALFNDEAIELIGKSRDLEPEIRCSKELGLR